MKDSKKKNKILTIHNKNIFQSSSNKIAVCILAYQPDERLIQLYNDLSKSNYDFYVIVDDNKYDISSLEKKYTSFHFIQIKEEECIKNGYYGLNYYVKKGEPSAWEKAIFYFSTQKINTYPFVWFLEDDVFIPQKDVILEIDRHYYGQNIDLLSKSNETFNRKWAHAPAVLEHAPSFLSKFLHISLICAIRLSNKFLNTIKDYVQENKRMFFAESFFITLADYYHLTTSQPQEFKTIFYRKNWTIQDIMKFPKNIIHPVKNISQQVNFRNFFQSNIKYFIIQHMHKFKNELENIHATFLGYHFIQKIGFIYQQKGGNIQNRLNADFLGRPLKGYIQKYVIITQDNQDFYIETIDIFANKSMFVDKIKINSFDEGITFAMNLGCTFQFYQNMISENYTDKQQDVSIKIIHIPSLVPFVQFESYSTDKLDDFTESIQYIGIKINSFFGLYEYNSQFFATTLQPFSNHEFKKLEKSIHYVKKNKSIYKDLIENQHKLYQYVLEELQTKNINPKIRTSNNFVNVH